REHPSRREPSHVRGPIHARSHLSQCQMKLEWRTCEIRHWERALRGFRQKTSNAYSQTWRAADRTVQSPEGRVSGIRFRYRYPARLRTLLLIRIGGAE